MDEVYGVVDGISIIITIASRDFFYLTAAYYTTLGLSSMYYIKLLWERMNEANGSF